MRIYLRGQHCKSNKLYRKRHNQHKSVFYSLWIFEFFNESKQHVYQWNIHEIRWGLIGNKCPLMTIESILNKAYTTCIYIVLLLSLSHSNAYKTYLMNEPSESVEQHARTQLIPKNHNRVAVAASWTVAHNDVHDKYCECVYVLEWVSVTSTP